MNDITLITYTIGTAIVMTALISFFILFSNKSKLDSANETIQSLREVNRDLIKNNNNLLDEMKELKNSKPFRDMKYNKNFKKNNSHVR